MGSSGSGSLSVLSGGFPSSNQPLMFKFIERKKWTKLRKILARKAGTDRCTERDESGLSLLGMAFGFEAPLDIIKSILEMDPTQADSRDSFGASPLHVACLNGASAEAVLYLLHKCQHLSSSMDKDRRIPLHHAAECLCRDEIEFNEGIQIINALVDVYPDSIHASDKLRDSPIDIVQLARYHARPDSKDSNRLAQLYLVLKDISVRVYKLNKDKSEEEGYTAHEMRKEDGSRFTNSTTSSSVASSFVTTFSNKETVRGMELSIMGNGDRAPAKQDNKQLTPGNGELDIPDNGKKTKSKLKFWKKKI
eukprot:scaffold435_cov275-Chaetoceros_neogracile.AAC.53